MQTMQNSEKYPRAIIIHKEWGETPLQALHVVRALYEISDTVPMTYAGRLDPLATGALIILIGEECKNKDAYLKFDKKYSATFVCGIQTDTGDIFGCVTDRELENMSLNQDISIVNDFMQACKDMKEQQYPLFSSKKVQGKQLFEYGIDGASGNGGVIQRPYRPIAVRSCVAEWGTSTKVSDLYDMCVQAGQKLGNGFRVDTIVLSWDFAKASKVSLPTLHVACTVSSGTYIRGFAEILNKISGKPWVMTSLHRESVGENFCPKKVHDNYVVLQ